MKTGLSDRSAEMITMRIGFTLERDDQIKLPSRNLAHSGCYHASRIIVSRGSNAALVRMSREIFDQPAVGPLEQIVLDERCDLLIITVRPRMIVWKVDRCRDVVVAPISFGIRIRIFRVNKPF